MPTPDENQGPPPPQDPARAEDAPAPPAPFADTPVTDATAALPPPPPPADTADTPTPAPAEGTRPGQPRRSLLSSLSFFLPFGNRNTENTQDEGLGMTVSLEMFPNDEEGAADAAVEDADALLADGPEGITVAEGNAPAHDGTPAAAGGAGAQPGGDLGAPGGGGPGRPGIGPNGRPMQQTMVFVFGPEDFGFNVPLFNQAVPVPDPAKAAELLAALPTIGRPLLRRVDKIITAEDANSSKEEEERGWRCGICLEGLDVDADEPASAHPVKGLPCNHLFHEECLQPWFTSHFTCPTCRMDLDPLRTAEEPTRSAPLRPAPTGSGRATPRNNPYARDREARDRLRSGARTPANPPTEAAAEAVAPAEPTQHEHEQQAQAQEAGQQAGDEARQPQAGAAGPGGPGGPGGPRGPPGHGLPPGLPGLQEILTNLIAQATAAAFNELPPMFQGNPMTASPAPMERADGAQPANQPQAPGTAAPIVPQTGDAAALNGLAPPLPEAGPSAEGIGPHRPTPERRHHIWARGPRRPETPTTPADRAQTPIERPAQVAPAPAPAAGSPEAADATDAPAPAPPGTPGPNAATENLRRHFNLPMEFRIFPMGFGAPPAPRPAPRPSTPIVTQSLGSWTEQREKGLGWRCDAVECLVATPVPDPSTEDDMDGDGDVSSDMPAEDKEMLSIYSATQHSPIPAPEPGQDPNAGVDANSEFVILACKDRWHRTCLETAERSAGHCTTSDKDGREWVRCPKCRKDGWVVPRSQPVTPPEPAEPATA